jgi:hypothetical protein
MICLPSLRKTKLLHRLNNQDRECQPPPPLVLQILDFDLVRWPKAPPPLVLQILDFDLLRWLKAPQPPAPPLQFILHNCEFMMPHLVLVLVVLFPNQEGQACLEH